MDVSSWNGATGNWRKAADWSSGIPGASTEADFTLPGPYTVTLSRSDAFSVGAVDFDSAGATLALQGSLTLGGVFDLEAGTLALSKAGVIHGGTLMMDGGTLSSQGGIGSKGGTLDAVSLAGTLDLAGTVEQLNITNGLTGAAGGAAAQIRLSGGEDTLQFIGSQTVDDVTIVLWDSLTFSAVYVTKKLTLGSGATLTTTAFGPEGVVAGRSVINDGAIISAASGAQGTLNIGLSGAFTNNGAVTAASDMSITAQTVLNGRHGTIDVGQSISVFIRGGFTNRGVMTVAQDGILGISSDTSIVNSGKIFAGSGSLSIDESANPDGATFSNSGEIAVNAEGSLSLLLNFTVASLGNLLDAGRLYLGGALDNNGGVVQLGEGPIFGGTGTTLGYGGLISGGTVVLNDADLAYTGGGLADLTFEGVLDLSAANAAVDLDGGVAITGAGGAGPGVVDLTGNGAALTFFDLTGSTVNGIDNVTINAGNAHGAVSIDLFNFDGAPETLDLGAQAKIISKSAGAQVIVQNEAFTNSTIVNAGQIDAQASGGSFSVTVTTLENDGRVLVANGDTFILTGALTGSGKTSIATGGTAVLGVAASSQGVAFADATGTLKLSSAASFAATLSGAAVGDRIDLLKTAATNASINASDQLVITNHGAAVAKLQLAGDYSDIVFNVGGDGAGGSVITLANAPAVHGLTQAMASLGGVSGAGVSAGVLLDAASPPTLARPTAV
jgi:hypothetical protein